MLVVVLLLPLSLAIGNGEFDHDCGGGSSGGPEVVAAAVIVVEVEDRDRGRWCLMLMAVAVLDGGHATTSPHSKRVVQKEDKKEAQGEATQQPANLPLQCHCNMWRCHLLHRHGVTPHCYLPCCHSDTWRCLWLHRHGNRRSLATSPWGYAALSSATPLWQ
jgi:hypothetical protein